MKKYLFYTISGFTQDENSKDIENCQLLGFSDGLDEMSAYDNLIKNNFYLKEYQYSKIFVQEIVGEPLRIL